MSFWRGLAMSDDVRRGMDQLLQRSGLLDASWVSRLSDIDEPPVYEQYSETAFLNVVPSTGRNALLLGATLDCLVATLDAIRTGGHPCSAMVTVQGWEEFESGEIDVVVPRLQVVPGVSARESMRGLVPPFTGRGDLVASWLSILPRQAAWRYGVWEPADRDAYEANGIPWRVFVTLQAT